MLWKMNGNRATSLSSREAWHSQALFVYYLQSKYKLYG